MNQFNKFLAIMAFYIILSYIVSPLIFYYVFNKTLLSAGNGFMFGSVVSILLWQFYGSKQL
jgi:hypothetical protein